MPRIPALQASLITLCACTAGAQEAEPKVLVYSRTAGFRHASIPDGIEAVRRIGAASGFGVDATEDPSWFTDERLREYAAVVFLSTTGDVLDEPGERAFERYIRGGGGYVGIHAAADTEYDWPWYGGLVGAYFKTHPRIQDATVLVADRTHPSTSHLPARWERRDEWYVYRDSPRGRVHVLASLDERTYEGGGMSHDHPIVWCHEYEGGRAWYTGGGHTKESFVEPGFVEHIRGGILWAMGRAEQAPKGAWGATVWSNYDKTVLDTDVTDPMELAVTPDGRVIFVERGGTIKVHRPGAEGRAGRTIVAGFIEVFDGLEDGLLGIALDPGFAKTGWFYVFYSPAGDVAENRVSRFTMVGDEVLGGSESVLLRIPTQRDQCCHSGGSLAFGPDGCLYISTGDNTNPFASDGYAPIDERTGREPWDAQRSSANTQDLRGKVLRIRPTRNGYEIPPGNLFADERAGQGRPEIYAMGCRNPFRISVDSETGWLYWGDVGPDARDPNELRGPAGHDEWNRAKEAGFFGWPYFVADNLAYRDYDFEGEEPGEPFNAEAPRNTSANNYGAESLPPAQPAWISYPYGPSEAYPEISEGGRCAMAGPAIRGFDGGERDGFAETALPAYFDDTVLIYEWTRNWIKEVKLDDSGDILGIWDFMPNTSFVRPMDLELGPDGRLYMIEWGSGFGGGNENAQIVRIDYYGGGLRPPKASASASTVDGQVPLRVTFSAEGSESRNEGAELSYEWDFDGDAVIDATGVSPTFTFDEAGDYFARVLVSDGLGQTASAGVAISAGNTAPTLEVVWPPNGGFLAFGEPVEYEMRVTDAEDGPEGVASGAEQRATAQILLGHDTHAHPLARTRGLTGTLASMRDGGHSADADLFTVLELTYRDGGAPYVTPITAREKIILQPKRKQAQHYTSMHGIQVEKVADPLGGGSSVAFIEDGDWVCYAPVNLAGIKAMAFRVASATEGGRIEARLGAIDGPLLAEVDVPGTGGWQEWTDVVVEIEDTAGRHRGTHDLFLIFRGGGGYLFNVNWIDFMGRGVAAQ